MRRRATGAGLLYRLCLSRRLRRSLPDAHEMMIREQQLVLDTICTKRVAIDNGVANIGTMVTLSTDRFARIYAYIEMWLEQGDDWRAKGEEWYEQAKEVFEQRKMLLRVRCQKDSFATLKVTRHSHRVS